MLRYLLLVLVCVSCSSKKVDSNEVTKKQPNVLFFLVDDFGWMDTSYQGSAFYETPKIDAMANQSMRFSQAYAAHPRCVPSRYAMITGKYPAREGIPGKGGKDLGKLKSTEFGIGKAFKNAGYTTFFAGKWHLASDEQFPEDQGFDFNYGGGHAGAPKSYFYPYNTPKNGYKGNGKEKIISNLDDAKEGDYLTDHLTRKTVDFIKNNTENPFFIYLSHYGVHTPFEGKETYKKYYEGKNDDKITAQVKYIEDNNAGQSKAIQDNATYAAMIQSIDESFGEITDLLKELNLDENTIIVFTSDHGGLSNRGNRRKLATSNLPLRAGKGHNYEGGIRVPMFIKWPGVTKNASSDQIVTGTDYYPTLLEMTNIPAQTNQHIDGISFADVLQGAALHNERPVFWHSPLPRLKSTGDRANTTVRVGNFKLIDFYEQDRVELYNIKEDIGEAYNLSTAMPEKTNELLNLITNWRKEVDAFQLEH